MKEIRSIVLFGFFAAFFACSVQADVIAGERKEMIQDCDECPQMVVIPPGSFMMGGRGEVTMIPQSDGHSLSLGYSSAPADNKIGGMFPDGGPPHVVTLAHSIAVGKFTVTFSEWDACVDAGACERYRPMDLGYGRGRLPVVYVNWQDAHEYVHWLSSKTGKKYRLLSEAEWEYVARANTTTAYYWGDKVGVNNANCGGCGSEWDTHKLAPVGSFAPNAFDLYDMLGNVWQWTEDCWHKGYVGAPSDGSPWVNGGDCSKRVMRGGGYQSPSFIIRAANRNYGNPADRSFGIGFRVARMYP